MRSHVICLDKRYLLLLLLVYIGECSGYKSTVLVSVRHAVVSSSYTSSGNRAAIADDFLNYDFNQHVRCTSLLGRFNQSWILIDFGYLVSGIAEVRFYGDNFDDSAHVLMSDIEIWSSKSLSQQQKRSLDTYTKKNGPDTLGMKLCGQTGTLASKTFRAFVSCSDAASARWLLFRRSGRITVCHARIYQNKVNPQCFLSSLNVDELLTKTVVYQSVKHISELQCRQSCSVANPNGAGRTATRQRISDANCEGIAFIPETRRSRVGMCQFLRLRIPAPLPGTVLSGSPFCDSGASCKFMLNQCHFGKSVYLGAAKTDVLLPLPPTDGDVKYLISLQLMGTLNCSLEMCGTLNFYVISSTTPGNGADSEAVFCASVNPQHYRIFDAHDLICETLIPNPIRVIVKSNPKFPISFNLQYIKARIINDQLHITLLSYLIQSSTSSTKPPSYINSTTTNRRSTSSTHKVTTTFSTTKTISRASTSTGVGKISSNSKFVSTRDYFTLPISSKSTRKKLSHISSSYLKYNYLISTPVPMFKRRKLKRSSSTTSVRPSTSQKSSTAILNSAILEGTAANNDKENINKGTLLNVDNASYNNNTTNLNNIENNTNSIGIDQYNISTAKSSNVIWFILLVFVFIFIFVTTIGLLVSSVQSRKRRKEWDLPDGGLCPPNDEIMFQSNQEQFSSLMNGS